MRPALGFHFMPAATVRNRAVSAYSTALRTGGSERSSVRPPFPRTRGEGWGMGRNVELHSPGKIHRIS
jgi:hypothetical protein